MGGVNPLPADSRPMGTDASGNRLLRIPSVIIN
jgi:hypothetical protein